MRLEADHVSFRYSKNTPWILEDVSMSMEEGEIVALMGSSGIGKSTLAKLLCGYLTPTMGNILLDGEALSKKGAMPVQLIYQHPEHAINPRWRMRQVLEESGMFQTAIMEGFGIEKEWLNRYPRELSGGELQRFCVARSLFSGTKFLIADEISTMLDVITQAQIWNYLLDEANKRHIGLFVITHNKALASKICTREIILDKTK